MSPHRLGMSIKARLGIVGAGYEQRPPGQERPLFSFDVALAAVVSVVGHRRGLQLTAGLLEQGLGFGCMPFHIPLICALRFGDAVIGLIAKPLRISKDRMAVRIDVALRSLRNCGAGYDETKA